MEVHKLITLIHHINKGQKSHNHLIRYINDLQQNQHPFMIKVQKSLWIHGTYLNTIEAIYRKFIVNITLNNNTNKKKTIKNISTKIRTKIRISTLLVLFNTWVESVAGRIRWAAEIKGKQIGKEEVSLLANTILSKKDSKDFTRKMSAADKHIQ